MSGYTKTTQAQRDEIVRRYLAGETTKAIAFDYKISAPMVGHYARAANAPRRRMEYKQMVKRTRK